MEAMVVLSRLRALEQNKLLIQRVILVEVLEARALLRQERLVHLALAEVALQILEGDSSGVGPDDALLEHFIVVADLVAGRGDQLPLQVLVLEQVSNRLLYRLVLQLSALPQNHTE